MLSQIQLEGVSDMGLIIEIVFLSRKKWKPI